MGGGEVYLLEYQAFFSRYIPVNNVSRSVDEETSWTDVRSRGLTVYTRPRLPLSSLQVKKIKTWMFHKNFTVQFASAKSSWVLTTLLQRSRRSRSKGWRRRSHDNGCSGKKNSSFSCNKIIFKILAMLEENHWYGTMLPRIPAKHLQEIRREIDNFRGTTRGGGPSVKERNSDKGRGSRRSRSRSPTRKKRRDPRELDDGPSSSYSSAR